MIGTEQPVDVGAEQRFALTGGLPTETRQMVMNDTTRMDWLWRTRKFAELAALAESELPKLNFMGETSALKSRWGEALLRLGRQKEAAILYSDALKLARDMATRPMIDPTGNDPRLSRALALCGMGDEAVAVMRRGVEAMPRETRLSDRWDCEIKLAEVYARLGRAPECVALLAELLNAPTGLTVPMLRIDPTWDKLRDDATFEAQLADPQNHAPL